ncbi:MAG: hypothetical protein RSF82_07945 [Angelakisella sp.]
MQGKNQLSGDQLSALLGAVAKKMGKSPEALEQELKSGNISDERVKQVISNKEELQALMESPQIKALLRELGQKK